jgi:hypothetical protein
LRSRAKENAERTLNALPRYDRLVAWTDNGYVQRSEFVTAQGKLTPLRAGCGGK